MDSKAPILSVDAYYKPGNMESNANRLAKIEGDNFKLIKNINIIYRTKVKIMHLYLIDLYVIVLIFNFELLVRH